MGAVVETEERWRDREKMERRMEGRMEGREGGRLGICEEAEKMPCGFDATATDLIRIISS